MSLHFPIRVPSELLEELGAFTGHFWSDSLALEPHICEAIRNYVANRSTQRQPAAPSDSPSDSPPHSQSELGYQWKELFLPDGTKLRANFGQEPYFAIVQGAAIKCGERAVSPSGFANLFGSGNRNAWKAVWLRLPGSDAWLLADVYRAARQAAITRLLTGEGDQARRGNVAEKRARRGKRRAKKNKSAK